MEKIKVAAVQMHSTPNKEENLIKAEAFVDTGAAQGARVVCLPEMFNYVGHLRDVPANSEPLDGPSIERLRKSAVKNAVYLIGGSVWEKVPNSSKVFNTSVLLSPQGNMMTTYRKMHLFDVDLPSVRYRESEVIEPGTSPSVAHTEYCEFGLTICYDLRFPELYRAEALAGAKVIFAPSGFTMFTGKDHWLPLIRSRAIENQVYIVAPNQIGSTPSGLAFYGRSMIVDPWGIVLSCARDEEEVIFADVDLEKQERIRRELPTLPRIRRDGYSLEM